MKSEIEVRLDELETTADVSKSRCVAALLPKIESLLSKGVSHKRILVILNESGLGLSESYYHDILYRLRKKKRLSDTAVRKYRKQQNQGTADVVNEETPSKLLGWDPEEDVDW